ncbi:hypothetical protein M9H77_02313 [Catharanthus roseus]|uniref:Uncharacterized protein n=1 Tax=Catharanthus roseus TaxID=4058 RepID=A0ACC0C8J8_CATRO|nr:hypothetical protein M9H77_02313 [Catharanthus roseus]
MFWEKQCWPRVSRAAAADGSPKKIPIYYFKAFLITITDPKKSKLKINLSLLQQFSSLPGTDTSHWNSSRAKPQVTSGKSKFKKTDLQICTTEETRTAARESFKIRTAESDEQHEIHDDRFSGERGSVPQKIQAGLTQISPSLSVLYSSTTRPHALSNQVNERRRRASREAAGVLENIELRSGCEERRKKKYKGGCSPKIRVTKRGKRDFIDGQSHLGKTGLNRPARHLGLRN